MGESGLALSAVQVGPHRGDEADTPGLDLAYTPADQTDHIALPGRPEQQHAYLGITQYDRLTTTTRPADADGGSGDAGTTVFTPASIGVTDITDPPGGPVGRMAVTRTPDGALVGLRLPDGQRGYYLTDALGSVVAVTDQAGQAVNRYAYTPHGHTRIEQQAIPNPFRYAGEHQDASGLYRIGARYYAPELGRWTQRDPLERAYNPVQTPEANAYAYVGGNPINHTDPSGLISYAGACFVDAAVSGAGYLVKTAAGAALAGAAPAAGAAAAGAAAAGAAGCVGGVVTNFVGRAIDRG